AGNMKTARDSAWPKIIAGTSVSGALATAFSTNPRSSSSLRMAAKGTSLNNMEHHPSAPYQESIFLPGQVPYCGAVQHIGQRNRHGHALRGTVDINPRERPEVLL